MTDLTQTIARIIDPEIFDEEILWSPDLQRMRQERALAKARQIIPLIEAGVRENLAKDMDRHAQAWREAPGRNAGHMEKQLSEMCARQFDDIAADIRAPNPSSTNQEQGGE